jgi:hypothetical protein
MVILILATRLRGRGVKYQGNVSERLNTSCAAAWKIVGNQLLGGENKYSTFLVAVFEHIE